MKHYLPILLFLLVGCRDSKQLPIYGQVPDFQLTAQTGKPFSSRELTGRVWVADFIYTTCTGPCPMMSSKMRRVQAADPHLLLLSFSVDPEHDTPEALAAYAARYHAQQNWYFLTGSRDTLQTLSRDAFKLSDLGITHSTRFVLVDQKGRIRGYYGTADEDPVRTLMADVRRLRNEKA
jgi:protein SCO1/2